MVHVMKTLNVTYGLNLISVSFSPRCNLQDDLIKLDVGSLIINSFDTTQNIIIKTCGGNFVSCVPSRDLH